MDSTHEATTTKSEGKTCHIERKDTACYGAVMDED